MLGFHLDLFLLGLRKDKALDYLASKDINVHVLREDNVFPIRRPAGNSVRLEVDNNKVTKVHFG